MTLGIKRTLTRLAVGALVATAGIVATASPAHATAITSPYLTCDSGGSEAICFFSWNGGTAPFTIEWFYNGQPYYPAANSTSMRRSCWANHTYTVKATVTDVHGHTASSEGQCWCNPGAWA